MPWLKAAHLLSIIGWMTGMLYLFRLFVVHARETEPVVKARLAELEAGLLRYAATPGAVLALLTGLMLLMPQAALMRSPWMHVKLTAVLGLFALHGVAAVMRKRLARGGAASPSRLALLGALPVGLLVAAVVMVVVRPL